MSTLTGRTATGIPVAWGVLLAWLWTAHAAAPPFTMAPFSPTAFVVQGSAMVPLRAIADITGATIQVDGTRYVTQRGKAEFACRKGQTTAVANGAGITLPVAPQAYDGSLYVPLRPLVAAFGGAINVVGANIVADIPGAPSMSLPMVSGGFIDQDTHPDLYLVALDTGVAQRLTYTEAESQQEIAFSPDGTRCVAARGGALYLRTPQLPNETFLRKERNFLDSSLAFLPDNKHFVYAAEDTDGNSCDIYMARTDGSERRLLVKGWHPVVSSDGDYLAYDTSNADDDEVVHMYQIATAKDVTIGLGRYSRFSPKGDRLLYRRAFTQPLGHYVTLTVTVPLNGLQAGQETLPDTRVFDGDEEDARFTPDGDHLLTNGEGIRMMSVDRREVHDLTLDPRDDDARCLPDGSGILFTHIAGVFDIASRAEYGVSDLWVMSPDGEAPRRVTHGLNVWSYQLTPDGAHALVWGKAVDPEQNNQWGPSAETLARYLEGPPAYTAEVADRYVAEVRPLVEKVCGMKFSKPPVVSLATRAELLRPLTAEMLARTRQLYPGITRSDALYSSRQNTNAQVLYTIGKYDADRKALLLAPANLLPFLKETDRDSALAVPVLKLVIAYELTHALQDEVVGLRTTYQQATSRDQTLAIAATLEGQAVFVMHQVAEDLQLADNAEYVAYWCEYDKWCWTLDDSHVMSEPVMKEVANGLYQSGYTTMRYLADHGGALEQWKMIATPPATTHLLFNPETYPLTTPEARPFIPKLTGVEMSLNDMYWTKGGMDLGELELRARFLSLDAADRDALFAAPISAETRIASDENRDVNVTLITTPNAATAVKYIQAAEKEDRTIPEKAWRVFYSVKDPVVADFTAAKGDLSRVRRLSYKANEEDAYTLTTVRVARGNVVAELVVDAMSRSDAELAATIEDIFRRASYAAADLDNSRYRTALVEIHYAIGTSFYVDYLRGLDLVSLCNRYPTMDIDIRDTLFAGMKTGATCQVWNRNGEGIVRVIACANPAAAVKYIREVEKVETSANLPVSKDQTVARNVAADFPLQGDLVRKRTLTLSLPDHTETIKTTIRAARGPLVVEIEFEDTKWTEADIVALTENIFNNLETPAK